MQFSLIAVGFEKYGSREALEQDAIKHLLDLYVKVNADADEDPAGRAEVAAFFMRMQDVRLNMHFDMYTGESRVSKESMDNALAQLDEMGLIEDEEVAKCVDLKKYKLGKAVVRKKDGTSIYLMRDIGGAIERYEKYKFDKMIYVISSQQDMHLLQFFKVLKLVGYEWADHLEHVNYGLVLGMSTQKGNQIIREATSVMHQHTKGNEDKCSSIEDPEATSQEIGITGVKVQDMAAKRMNIYTFNWDRMLSFEGDTGPYLQYALVGFCSISRKNAELFPLPPRS
ncbi:Arginine--tRNA ligase, cytoplasmic [Sparassis crispa]|uniref:Arginine--tRNA ligase, cytoplasmic n=1 Tax=Sparassis crispa TaxID=139825 RepID=A0A401H302_9APHY|nr:Arginine--tRNA ligase, cytoplasmic [Sparassis crispa]GBE88791.1 Arginine--tRNA ligase, cytoplasmic [Sparassis crispa]